jgi:hypothetical protein
MTKTSYYKEFLLLNHISNSGIYKLVAVRIKYDRNTFRIVIYFVTGMFKKVLVTASLKFSVVYQQICCVFCPEFLEHY